MQELATLFPCVQALDWPQCDVPYESEVPQPSLLWSHLQLLVLPANAQASVPYLQYGATIERVRFFGGMRKYSLDLCWRQMIERRVTVDTVECDTYCGQCDDEYKQELSDWISNTPNVRNLCVLDSITNRTVYYVTRKE